MARHEVIARVVALDRDFLVAFRLERERLQIRPAEEQGARPILQALTLQPEGHKEITVERDDAGNYLVASHDRPTRW